MKQRIEAIIEVDIPEEYGQRLAGYMRLSMELDPNGVKDQLRERITERLLALGDPNEVALGVALGYRHTLWDSEGRLLASTTFMADPPVLEGINGVISVETF